MERIEIFFPFKKISTILQSYQHYILERSFSERGGGGGVGKGVLPQIITQETKAVLNRLPFLTP